ncbi:hypothetical protein EW146_g8501 [Bondarzewia mesenterica]|uniref:protein-tyrosine-phosphatase n=1 Tax=Bondarzewia mesenterica TaxID=1095465 RepID=A0A4V3XDJ9_9AGAM|nr:hypothetical protein EW146_g8501 [Bondarzewia mesenterica]
MRLSPMSMSLFARLASPGPVPDTTLTSGVTLSSFPRRRPRHRPRIHPPTPSIHPLCVAMGWKNVSAVIEGRLFLGNLVSAQSTRSLTERRITHIVSVCTDPIPAEHPQSGIRHIRIPVHDADHEDLLIWMPHACRFIEDALRAGGVVLVHGVYGLSRSATVMAAYLMYSRRISSTDALDTVRRGKAPPPSSQSEPDLTSHPCDTAREQIWPNAGFLEQLSMFEMCRYAPSMNEGIYVRWRQHMDRRLQGGHP